MVEYLKNLYKKNKLIISFFYADKSVLESHHVAASFEVVYDT